VIPKDALRIGKHVPFKDKQILQFFHIECAFESFEKARVATNIITDITELDGVEGITDDEKLQIINLIIAANTKRQKPLQQPSTTIYSPSTTTTRQTTQPRRLKSYNTPSINVMFTNADQLTSTKMSELKTRIQREKPLIIAVCEVKPKNSKDMVRTISDYAIPNYTIHPLNFDTRIGRGMAVYTHSSLDKSVIKIKQEVGFDEVCLLEVKLRGGDLMLFGSFYRSPTQTDTSVKNNENLNRLLKNISNKGYSHKCLVGDFNYKDVNWISWTTFHNDESKESKFIETIRDCYLHQHNEENSRRRGNDEPSLIDLIFTDEALQVSDVTHHAPLGKSDHDVITFNFNCYLDYSKPKERYSYEKADYDAMRRYLAESNWKEEYLVSGSVYNVEKSWNILKSKLMELREKFVPKLKFSGKPTWKDKGSFPIDKPLQEAIRSKHTAHRHWMSAIHRDDTNAARLRYTRARNKVKTLMRQAKRRFEREIARKSKSDPKVFWKHIRNRLKTKSGVAPLLEKNEDKDSMKFSDEEKANILQNQFSSTYVREPEGEIPKLSYRTENTIYDLKVTSEMVRQDIINMNVNKSCGPDEIPPRILKELIDYLSEPIALLLNKTMESGDLPLDWKRAYVSPIFKKGSKNHAENYRPISLTSVICKLMEIFIKQVIMQHLVDQNLLSPKQYGFISGRSTTTQLLNYLDKCIEKIVMGGVVDTIYLDFSKAFDCVPHRRLIGKLESYGVTGNILKWIKAFLSGRNQVVKVNGAESKSSSVISGVPQGSVLGPILFIVYINDLLENIESEGLLFADDTKIFNYIASRKDALTLQSDIYSLENWSQKWLLSFHPDKCHVLTTGKFENIRHTHRYTVNNRELEHVFEEKDLGVVMDSDLNFEEHMSLKINKANAIMGMIRRSFTFLDCHLFRKLYITFVRPHLEYAQAVWSPHLVKHVNMIENVQKRATKLVDGLSDLDYPERLKKLDLPTLIYRRARGDMIELWKHFHTYDKASLSNRLQPHNRESRIHDYQLVWNKPKDGIRGLQANSFYFRTIKTWNNLPKDVVNAKDIDNFKRLLDVAWTNNTMKYNHLRQSDS
jgi:ribonuclease P/MRP protein subunit RPP40